MNLEVIGPHHGVIDLSPANLEETRGIASALAFLLDDLCGGKTEEHGDLAVLPRHEPAEFVIGLESFEEPFADRPLPLAHLGHFVTSNGQERVGAGTADEHLARRAEPLDDLGHVVVGVRDGGQGTRESETCRAQRPHRLFEQSPELAVGAPRGDHVQFDKRACLSGPDEDVLHGLRRQLASQDAQQDERVEARDVLPFEVCCRFVRVEVHPIMLFSQALRIAHW